MASIAWKDKFDLGNLNYPSINVHIANNSHFGGLWGRDSLQMASEVKSDLWIQLNDLDYIWSSGPLAFNLLIFQESQEAKCHPLTCVASPQVKIFRHSDSPLNDTKEWYVDVMGYADGNP